jgi:hypothetical protein
LGPEAADVPGLVTSHSYQQPTANSYPEQLYTLLIYMILCFVCLYWEGLERQLIVKRKENLSQISFDCWHKMSVGSQRGWDFPPYNPTQTYAGSLDLPSHAVESYRRTESRRA